MVTGGPGMGKSAILSAWLARRQAGGAVVPHHFIRRQVADWDQPEVIAVSLAAQIEAAFPEQRDPDAVPERRLLELLGRVSRQIGSSRNLVVLVDGLDETRADAGDNPLPRFLPHVVPDGIRFLCATRPTYPHLSWIEARSPIRRLDLDDAGWVASNEAVIRGFWESVAPGYQPPLSAETMAIARARADGNVLHAVMLHDALRDLPASERRADRIPRQLKGLIAEILRRAIAHDGVRDGLGLLCAAQQALSPDVLAQLAGWSFEDKERFLSETRQLLLEKSASWAGDDAYRPRHDWVRELITELLGAEAIRGHHRTLSRRLATWPPPGDAAGRSYAVHHALAHRIAIGDWAGVRELALDLGHLEARVREADVATVEQELRDAGMTCPEPAVARDLAELARALARESHWVRDDPTGTAGLIWNRLRRTGWTVADLDARVALPKDAGFLRARHAASRESHALARTLDDHTSEVNACAVTPDGRCLVSASSDRTLKIWDLEAGRVLGVLHGHAARVAACAVTPDGRRVVSASHDGTLRVWDFATGRVLATLDGHVDRVSACAVTPDGRRVVSASHDGELKVWDLDAGRVLVALDGHADKVNACAVMPDGRRVISASSDRALKVWDLDTGGCLATLTGHAGAVTACAATPDGRSLVSASHDGTIKVWDLDLGRAVATSESHADRVTACVVTPDGRRVISTATDGALRIWDLDGNMLATLEGHVAGVNACAVTPDGRRVVSASSDHTLKVWDLDAGARSAPLDGHRVGAAPPDHAPNGRGLDAGARSAALDGHVAGVKACAVTPDGRFAVSGSRDGTLKVWDVEHGAVVRTLSGGAGVRACAVTPDGRRLVSGARDGTLQVWDLKVGLRLARLQAHSSAVNACVVSPDGSWVASGSGDGMVKIWNLDTRKKLHAFDTYTRGVNACAVTPDGQRLILASRDGMLEIWKWTKDGRDVATLTGHAQWVSAYAVTPDGRRVVSASGDCTLKIWDLDTGRMLATLDSHAGGVNGCAVTRDGRHAVSASSDRTIKVWDLETTACLVTHRGDAAFHCVTAVDGGVIAGDAVGTLWFLDGPLTYPPSQIRSRGPRTPSKQPTTYPNEAAANQSDSHIELMVGPIAST